MKNYKLAATAAALACALSLMSAPAAAQSADAQRVGVNGKVLESIPLANMLDGGAARSLRMRQVTIDPGGLLPLHSHADRPSVSYVLRGTVTETFEDTGESRRLSAGQSYETHGARRHALQNLEQEPAVFIEVDLPR
ncbi:cupin domain-containing protein [Janthinobacterium sp. PC23-8]|uniref:cupin domain-containing protein n=1 Tax=Janthinobacterium sp. PC23-8 TaxID=2012679 RepID=UPI000B966B18|nr:cupin domain-containing protein [Janthinobacterium sp. PC23-8]OYO25753.1 hypothetical protein CD932_27040 [Janthinobacterium sp. PC23-8]